MPVLGVGVDVCSVQRMAVALARTPALAARLFTSAELGVGTPERLAARFAAKEAVAKALARPWAGGWHDVEVVLSAGGAPSLAVRGGVAEAGSALGVTAWHVSLSHDGGVAMAFVVLSG